MVGHWGGLSKGSLHFEWHLGTLCLGNFFIKKNNKNIFFFLILLYDETRSKWVKIEMGNFMHGYSHYIFEGLGSLLIPEYIHIFPSLVFFSTVVALYPDLTQHKIIIKEICYMYAIYEQNAGYSCYIFQTCIKCRFFLLYRIQKTNF